MAWAEDHPRCALWGFGLVLWVWWLANLLLVGLKLRGAVFAVLFIFSAAFPAGLLMKEYTPLPPLLGMLFAGAVLRNVPGNLLGGLPASWSSALRSLALVVIMARAGLGLDLQKLRKVGASTLRLAFMPCACEALCVAVLSVVFPWPKVSLSPAWGALLGWVIAAVSPAVVVPGLLDLQAKGYGVDQGIPTIVLAAASLDDVLAISGFGVCLSLVTSSGSLWWLIIKGPLELVLGLLLGLLLSLVVSSTPDSFGRRGRLAALLAGGVLTVFGGRQVEMSGGGALGVVVLGCAAAAQWDKASKPGTAEAGLLKKEVADDLNSLWTSLAQPLLFGLLGASVRFDVLGGSTLGLAFALMCCGLVVRALVTVLAVLPLAYYSPKLTRSELAFFPVAWIPKATVQAAGWSPSLRVLSLQTCLEMFVSTVFRDQTWPCFDLCFVLQLGALHSMLRSHRVWETMRKPVACSCSPSAWSPSL